MRWFLVLFFSYLCSTPSHAQYFQADFMKKRLFEKESSRWTISDWLAQKSKVRFADLWLLQNTKESPWEIELEARYFDFDQQSRVQSLTTETEDSRWSYSAALFFSRLGLKVGHGDERKQSKTMVEMNVRLLGLSQQSTRVNVGYGFQRRDFETSNERCDQQFARLDTNIYISHFLGLEADYAYYFKNESSLQRDLNSSVASYGLFLEMGVFRLFAHYLLENDEIVSENSLTKIQSKGMEYGAKILF